MKDDSENRERNDLRNEIRAASQESASVEFIPGNNEIPYHFKLKDFSSKGFGIIVRKDSRVLKYIKTGDVIDMKYHPAEATATPVPHKTEIKHISEPEPGKHQNHLLVGLMILD